MTDISYQEINKKLENLFTKDLFFVCGVIKSGTTWLERILDSHPEVVCRGEGHFGSDLYSLLSEAMNTYNEAMPKKGKAFAHSNSTTKYSDVPSYNNTDQDFIITTTIGLMMAKWLDRETDLTEVKCVGDKTPSNLVNMQLLSRLFPMAKFIHIIRDGRDVAVSAWNFNMNTDIGATIRQWGNFRKFVPWAAEAWANEIKVNREVGLSYGERYIELRYEDLVANPHKEASRVFQYLDVDISKSLIQQCIDKCTFTKLSGGRESGEEDNESFYRKGVAGDWKNHLDDELSEIFISKAGDVLVDCGYSLT